MLKQDCNTRRTGCDTNATRNRQVGTRTEGARLDSPAPTRMRMAWPAPHRLDGEDPSQQQHPLHRSSRRPYYAVASGHQHELLHRHHRSSREPYYAIAIGHPSTTVTRGRRPKDVRRTSFEDDHHATTGPIDNSRQTIDTEQNRTEHGQKTGPPGNLILF